MSCEIRHGYQLKLSGPKGFAPTTLFAETLEELDEVFEEHLKRLQAVTERRAEVYWARVAGMQRTAYEAARGKLNGAADTALAQGETR